MDDIVYLNEAEACGEPVVGYLGYDHIARLEPVSRRRSCRR